MHQKKVELARENPHTNDKQTQSAEKMQVTNSNFCAKQCSARKCTQIREAGAIPNGKNVNRCVSHSTTRKFRIMMTKRNSTATAPT
jgi:hypothetical protein